MKRFDEFLVLLGIGINIAIISVATIALAATFLSP